MNIITKTGAHAFEAGGMNELIQVAVLPWRIHRNGEPKILLITSRHQERWIVPMGWPEEGSSPLAAASREAFEKAGIIGDMSPAPVTTYRYVRSLDDGSKASCRVAVFGMKVRGTLIQWREKGKRQRQWFSPKAAADRLGDFHLAEFVTTLDAAPERLAPSGRSARPSLQLAEPYNVRG